jgi:aminopeptidase N
MDTTLLMKKALAEAQLSVMLFTDYFGPSSYKHLAVTQQTAFTYGQAWPGVVWLPISYFFDSTVRHQLGMDDPRGYFKTVGPHEVAHQWWGHTVGFHSYRDQWISEGFAEMAASLFIQMIQKKPQEFIKFWDDQSWLLTEKNKEGFRPIDAGPVTLGYRLATTKSGFDIPRRLIYPKGGYILHMVRMMMWSPQTGDDAFKVTLKDFVRTYANRAATTEDFKKTVEKHMTSQMNVRGDGKMDWFFDEYVYGTALPTYRLEHSFSEAPEGPVLSVKVRQSNVDDKFTMIVPLYLELASGKVFRLGSAAMTGNATLEQKVPLRGLPEKPKRAMLNYFNDVLCTMEK